MLRSRDSAIARRARSAPTRSVCECSRWHATHRPASTALGRFHRSDSHAGRRHRRTESRAALQTVPRTATCDPQCGRGSRWRVRRAPPCTPHLEAAIHRSSTPHRRIPQRRGGSSRPSIRRGAHARRKPENHTGRRRDPNADDRETRRRCPWERDPIFPDIAGCAAPPSCAVAPSSVALHRSSGPACPALRSSGSRIPRRREFGPAKSR